MPVARTVYRPASCAIAAAILLLAISGCASHPQPASQTTRAAQQVEPSLPPLTAPPIEGVRSELVLMRSGTGIKTPRHIYFGEPVRIFRLKTHASGDRVQDLIDPSHVTLLYPVLSSRGLEGELTYEPWNPGSYRDGMLGDAEGNVPASSSVAAGYAADIAKLPSLGTSSTTGVVAVSAAYRVPVAWTATGSVGVFQPSGLTGARVEGSPPPPSFPTGVVLRDAQLARQLRAAQ